MITQTAGRSCRQGRPSVIRVAIGAAILAVPGCAGIEVGAQAYKTLARSNEPGPPAGPGPAEAVPARG